MHSEHEMTSDAESVRLQEDARREKNWKRWGPYLSSRQWGTVREDYSADGDCWRYFPHDHARSRVYRWGEDGLLGICDRECRLCFAPALWNGKDPILKERLFGLTGPEGNHGEDVKELYYFLDSSPTHAYMKALYKYPQGAFPYEQLVRENARRGRGDPEFEILDTGIFDENRYFDVQVEYAKASPDDVLIRFTVSNRGPDAAVLHLLPTLWFRNTWCWGRTGEGYGPKPAISLERGGIRADHATLGRFRLEAVGEAPDEFLFTGNETNNERLFGAPSGSPFVKDAFHEFIVHGRPEAVNPDRTGTKAAALFRLEIPAGGERVVRLRLRAETAPETAATAPAAEAAPTAEAAPAAPTASAVEEFERILAERIAETDAFYAHRIPEQLGDEQRRVARQAYAGLLWTKQYYNYVVRDWLEGDPAEPPAPPARRFGRNSDWMHLYNRDVISMPDGWEYPWYAAWDLAFHVIAFARVDPAFAKEQLALFVREWYQHPNGQLPAYEYSLSDVNPPVHAWAAWRVYKMTGARGRRDRLFLERVFQKLVINFTWWVNRKDPEGRHLFSGGFLGLDNIGVFDRSKPLPNGGRLEQADGTAWMAFYCATMLSMALELASEDAAYEDVASTFFEHFIAITDAMNGIGGTGLWDDTDGFYYDQLLTDGTQLPIRVRSMVGIIPLFACENLDQAMIDKLPGFRKRLDWFLENRKDLARLITYMEGKPGDGHRLLAIPSRERLARVLRTLLDEREFLSPYGLRSLSRVHAEHPFVLRLHGHEYRVAYAPGESDSGLFGGNSNWRGPVWIPLNFLVIETLQRYHHFYGDSLRVECPAGSGRLMNLEEVAKDLAARLSRIFLPDASGRRPCHGGEARYANDPHWKDLVLFYECFHGDTGRGVGASHQTGWTALVAKCLEEV